MCFPLTKHPILLSSEHMHVFWCFKFLIYKEDKTSEIYIFRLAAGSARVSGSDPLSSGILPPFVTLPTGILGLELQESSWAKSEEENAGRLILTRSLEWFMSFSSLLLFDRRRKRKLLPIKKWVREEGAGTHVSTEDQKQEGKWLLTGSLTFSRGQAGEKFQLGEKNPVGSWGCWKQYCYLTQDSEGNRNQTAI